MIPIKNKSRSKCFIYSPLHFIRKFVSLYSVSYTHLDVYKRQELSQALLEGNSTDFCEFYETSDEQVLERVKNYDIRLSSKEEK